MDLYNLNVWLIMLIPALPGTPKRYPWSKHHFSALKMFITASKSTSLDWSISIANFIRGFYTRLGFKGHIVGDYTGVPIRPCCLYQVIKLLGQAWASPILAWSMNAQWSCLLNGNHILLSIYLIQFLLTQPHLSDDYHGSSYNDNNQSFWYILKHWLN